jgi:hypothetical protein
MLESAEQAAFSGDFSSADELLRNAARIQEAELGPLHPDVANTMNSLAIVAERMGRLADAEAFYRRAAAIASVSLPADDPMVAESRKNLEDFCRERGVPVTAAVVMTPSAEDTALGLDSFAPEVASNTAGVRTTVRTIDAGVSTRAGGVSTPVGPPSSGRPSPVPRAPAATASKPLPPAPRRSSRQFPWLAVGAIALIAVAALWRQSWWSREASVPAITAPQLNEPALAEPRVAPRPAPQAPQASEPTVPAPQAADSVVSPPPLPVPAEQALPQKVVPPDDDRDVATDKPPPAALSSGPISLTAAELCQTFSTTGGSWQCDPPGASVAPGPLVLYTRVRSARDAAVVHRWYREDMLRQALTLTVRANMSEGFRTYSRHTVNRGNWRVEVRNADGGLLHEQRFEVR